MTKKVNKKERSVVGDVDLSNIADCRLQQAKRSKIKKVDNNINENEVNNKTNGTVICSTKHIDMKTGEVLSSKNIVAYDDGLKEISIDNEQETENQNQEISIDNQAEDLSKLSKEELLERVNQLKKENSKLKRIEMRTKKKGMVNNT